MGQRRLGRCDDSRDFRHARQAIGDVGFLRQRRLRQQQINAVVDVAAVSARVFLERTRVFRQPDFRLQLVLKYLEINLAVAGQRL